MKYLRSRDIDVCVGLSHYAINENVCHPDQI